VNFSEQPPSKQWAALKYRGEKLAEVWFKPEGDPYGLTFRIPRATFQIPGLSPLLTTENLLKAVGIGTEEIDSCRLESASPSDQSGQDLDLRHPLPSPPQDRAHLTIHLSLKQPPQTVGSEESGEPPQQAVEPEERSEVPPQAGVADDSSEPEVPESRWQELEARWKAIQMRISMESLRTEMEASSRKTLTSDEKIHALNADVAIWNKAKSRVVHAVPKVREFIHRATWAAGAPERKKLEELFKDYIRPRIPFPHMDKVLEQLENLFKDRQVLSSHGVSVYQECKSVATDVQGTLRTLQSNAAANATKKRAARR
jgi:hypothetical protein